MARVKVPQNEGEIVLSTGDEDSALRYSVTDGHITVKADDLPLVLAHVDGATEAKPASTTKEK